MVEKKKFSSTCGFKSTSVAKRPNKAAVTASINQWADRRIFCRWLWIKRLLRSIPHVTNHGSRLARRKVVAGSPYKVRRAGVGLPPPEKGKTSERTRLKYVPIEPTPGRTFKAFRPDPLRCPRHGHAFLHILLESGSYRSL